MYQYQPLQNPYAQGQIAAQRLAQMPNPYQAQMQQPQQPNELQFVNGRESVDMYPMPPNSKVILMDSNMPRFYLKETDASGMARVATYDFTPANEKPVEEYVTRQEFEDWKAKYESLNEQSIPKSDDKPAAKRTSSKQANAQRLYWHGDSKWSKKP